MKNKFEIMCVHVLTILILEKLFFSVKRLEYKKKQEKNRTIGNCISAEIYCAKQRRRKKNDLLSFDCGVWKIMHVSCNHIHVVTN